MNMIKYKTWFKSSMRYAAITSVLLFSAVLQAAKDINVSPVTGLAIHGYDPVAYFVDKEARRGDEKFRYQYDGVTWQFASEVNRQSFIDSPQSYLPEYGGHCAYAASKNALADVDPAAWTIHNDKLYLNYSYRVRHKWLANRDSNRIKADGYWPELAKQINY